MRRKETIAILIFVLLFGILGSSSAAVDKLDLKLRPEPGKKHGMRIATKQNISQTMMGKEQDIVHTKNYGVEAEAKEADANGVTSIEITFRTLKEQTTIGGTTRGYDYDSTKPDAAADDPFAQMYLAMMGESFIARITPQGRIVELELDKMFLRMAEKMMAAEDELIEEKMKERAKAVIERTNKRYGSREKRKQALKERIEQFPSFSEKQIRSVASNIIAVFPPSPMQIGDSWKDKITVGSVSPVEIDSTHTLKGHEKGTVTINVSGKRSLDDKPAIQKTGPIKSSTRLAGSYNATIKVDEKSGWLISKRADMRFSGDTKITGNKEKPKGMTMAISIESIVNIESVE